MLYDEDLAFIHHTGFGAFARDAAPGLLDYLRRAGIQRGLVIDLACGSGIWARELIRAGYDVLGIDVSPAMIELAHRTAPGADLVVASAHQASLLRCVAVTAIGEGITYLPDGEGDVDLPGLFRRVHDALEPGGLFIFDVVTRAGADGPMRYRTTRSGPGWRVDVEVSEDIAAGALTREIVTEREVGGERRRSREVHRLRTYAPAEVERWLHDAGFTVEVTRRYGEMELPPRRMGFVAVRVDGSGAG